MAIRMQQRRGTQAQWAAADPTLAAGEIGFETDTGKFKIGDGNTSWLSLKYFLNLEALDIDADGFITDDQKGVPNGVASLNANGHVPIAQLGSLIGNAPESLNTLNEIAEALSSVENSIEIHNQDTTDVHGIADTSVLTTTTQVNEILDAHAETTANVHGIADTTALATSSFVTQSLNTHNLDTTNVHGIADTSQLATSTDVSNHTSLTANVHGIADTSLLATTASVLSDISVHNSDTTDVHGIANTASLATKTYADNAVSGHNSNTTNVHGIADTANLVLTNDSRLSDTRTPTDASVTTAKIATEGIAQSAVTNLTTDLSAKATLASPALTGTPTAPTAAAGTNTTQIATTAFVTGAVADLVASAPAALNTLNELATALGNDANFATTVTNSLATKASTTDLNNAMLYSFANKTSSYTLALSDSTNMVEMDSSSATTVTVPPNSSVAFTIGSTIDIFQKGTGQVTVAAGSGVTIYATPGNKLRAQYSGATLIKRDTNTWILTGDIVA